MRAAIAEWGEAVIVLATGASQFETMAVLTAAPGIAWDRVTPFYLDNYIGVPADHPASFGVTCGSASWNRSATEPACMRSMARRRTRRPRRHGCPR